MGLKKSHLGGRVGRQKLSLHRDCGRLLVRSSEYDLSRVVVLRTTEESRTEVDLDVSIDCEDVNHFEVITGEYLVGTHALAVGFWKMKVYSRLSRGVEPTYHTVDAVGVLSSNALNPTDPFIASLRNGVGTTENAARESERAKSG